jgi:phage terminase large subunit-like protein
MKGRHAAEVLEYAQAVASGEKLAGKELVQCCKRFLTDLESERWEIRTRDADFVIGVIEQKFKHRTGEELDCMPLRGKPLLLEPWEKFIIYGIMIFYLPGTDERRIKEAFIFVPRKNKRLRFRGRQQRARTGKNLVFTPLPGPQTRKQIT